MKSALKLFAQLGDSAFAVDQDQRILTWNAAAAEMLGYSADEVCGLSCWQLLQGHHDDGHRHCSSPCAMLTKVMDGEGVRAVDVRVRHRAGHWIVACMTTVPIPPKFADNKNLIVVHMLYPRAEPEIGAEPCLRIMLLGPVSAVRPDGSTVNGRLWRRGKVRALLAYLCLRRSQPLSRETLADTLWPDLDYDASLANLNTTVYYLRRSLEPNLSRPAQSSYIRCENGMYWLASDMAYTLDIDEFEAGLLAVRSETDELTKFELYASSVALYRGALLEDLDATHPWLLTERQRYHDLYLGAIEALGALHEQCGAVFEAEQLYAKALAFDPCNESVARRLINLLVKSGRRQNAIAYCRLLRSMLQDDLGITPSSETAAVCRSAWCEQPTE